jgi:hypothetical protein
VRTLQLLNFSLNFLRPDLPAILATMFAFIAVIVKGETRIVSGQRSAVSYQQKPGLIPVEGFTLESLG